MTLSKPSVRNRLLQAMSEDDFARLAPRLEPVTLSVKDMLVEPNQPIEHVHFLEEGLASVVAISPDNERLEVGHIGREGMTGEPVILTVDRTPHQTFIQVAGSGLRMRAEALWGAMEASPSLKALLLRWVQVLMIQTAQSALANGRYTIQERLARWLLMCHDRLDGDDLPLTHEFLSLMLGVRRSGVTEALHVLEGVKIVRTSRGRIHILDREKLEEIAGDCYGLSEAEYAKLIGLPLKNSAE
jgi:CRP-like cAMP-binding protein